MPEHAGVRFWRNSTARPSAPAIDDGTSVSTYSEVDDQVGRLAAGLVELGVRPGDRIALVLPNTPIFFLLTHAAWRIGAVQAPLNAQSGEREIAAGLRLAEPRVIIATAVHGAVIEELGRELGISGSTVVVNPSTGPAGYQSLLGTNPVQHVTAQEIDEPAIISFTTGTTGVPKAAVLSHRNISVAMDVFAQTAGFSSDDVILHILPNHPVATSTAATLLAWHLGAMAVPLERFAPDRFARAVARSRPTFFGSVPTMWDDLLNSDLDIDMSSVRFATFGGAPSPGKLRDAVRHRFGVTLVESYGMTEVPMIAVMSPPDELPPPSGIGRPLPHIQVDVCDETGTQLPSGSIGELTLRGTSTGPWSGLYRPFLGYWRDPQTTTQVLRGNRLHTGDLGRVDDEGVVHLSGRLKDIIIRGGNNISAVELESTLLEDDRITAAYVIGLPHDRLGEVPVACVVLAPGAVLDEDAVKLLVSARLAPYKRLEQVFFVTSNVLPRNAMGKVVKHELVKNLMALRQE